jgi:hypothetical protein
MSVSTSLLPELEEVVAHGSVEKRAETLRRITSLLLDGAACGALLAGASGDGVGYFFLKIKYPGVRSSRLALAS